RANGVAEGMPHDAFSVSNTRVPSVPAQGGGLRYANFLVSAVNPSQQTELEVDLTWEAGFLEHRIAARDAASGYVPSSWLRVIATPTAERLSFELDAISVPIPSVRYPIAPVLIAHAAVQQGGGASADSGDL